jgi:hypothetical protein
VERDPKKIAAEDVAPPQGERDELSAAQNEGARGGYDPAPNKKTVNVDLSKMLDIAKVGIRRASSFMALGLRVAADDTIRSVRLDTNFQIAFMPDPLSAEQSADVRANFAKWVISNALRELEQHFAAYVDAAYPALVATKTKGIPLRELLLQQKTMVNDTNLGSKLRRLEVEFGIKSSSLDHIASMSHARNALTHNLGRVATRHCNDGQTLKLTWRGMDMMIGDKAISGSFEPVRAEKGASIGVGFPLRERVFKIGQVVELSPHDLSEICLTFNHQADELHRTLIKYAKDNGVPFHVKSAASDTGLASEL